MTQVFVSLLNRSISASWLILAVILLRLALKKAPGWSVTLLWSLVGLRLISPFSIQSALSLVPSAQTVPSDIGFAMIPAIDSGVSSIDAVVNPYISQFAPTPTNAMSSINPIQIFGGILANIWFLGLVAMLGYAAFTWLRLSRQVRTSVLLRDNIYQTDTIDTPFVLGLLKPRIYLPFSLKEPDLFHVLAHEQSHIRRKDHWWKPLGFLLLSIHWFNPLVWIAWLLLCRDIELACDEAVIQTLDRDGRANYSQALLSCASRTRLIAACPLAFGEVGVKERVKHVLYYKKPGFWIALIAAVLCIAVAVCFLTDPAEGEQSETVTFRAEVLEVYPDHILVRPTEWSNPEYTDDKLKVSTVDFNLDLKPGDTVAVEYDGITIQTYPALIVKPDNILKVASGLNPEEYEKQEEELKNDLASQQAAYQDAILASQLVANFNGVLYANPGTPSPMEVDTSAIIGTLHTQVEGRPTNHCQANFDCEGCVYARLREGYAVLIDNEWYLFTEVRFASPRYYLTIGEEGVAQIEVRADGRLFLMVQEPTSESGFPVYEKDEVILLECLTGRLHLRGVTITAKDTEGKDLFSVSISSRNYGTADSVIECDGWIITPKA